MRITKQLRDLTPGTVIYRQTGDIVLTSEYDPFHGWYFCNNIEYTDDGDAYEVDGGYVTPADLLGDEYF